MLRIRPQVNERYRDFATVVPIFEHLGGHGPHITVVGAGAKSLGLPVTADADPTNPYMMWAGNPYEHAIIPVGGAGGAAKTATAATSDGDKK